MWPRNASIEPSEWRSPAGRHRVLIEHHDSSISVAVENLLVAEGYEVAHCRGPGDGAGVCPLVKTDQCTRAEQADLVFYGLEISDEDDREVLRRLKAHFADLPIIVEMPESRIAYYRDELEGCVVVPQPITRETLLQAVDKALR